MDKWSECARDTSVCVCVCVCVFVCGGGWVGRRWERTLYFVLLRCIAERYVNNIRCRG